MQTKLFFRFGALVLAGATAQLLNFAAIPFIARIFGPDEYGRFSEFYAYFQILLPISALGLPLAIVIAKDSIEAQGIAAASLFAGILVASLTVLAFFLLALSIPSRFTPTECLLAVVVLCAAIQQVGYQRLMRFEIVPAMAALIVLQALLMNAARIASGVFYAPTHHSLILSTILAYALFAGITILVARFCAPSILDWLSGRSIKQVFSAHREFPIYRAPQMLINGIGRTMPILFLAYTSTPELTGQFAMAFVVLGAALMLVGNAVSGVFYPRMARAFREGERHFRILLQATGATLFLGATGYGLALIAGPELFALILGAEWTDGGRFAQLMVPWFVASLAARPATDSIAVYGLNRNLLLFEVFALTIRLGSLFCGLAANGAYGAIAAFSVVNLILYVALIVTVSRHSRKLQTTQICVP